METKKYFIHNNVPQYFPESMAKNLCALNTFVSQNGALQIHEIT